MKRNMLKVVAASLAGAMLLTACGGGSSSSTQTTAAAGNSAETSAAAEAGSTGGEKVITMAQTGDWDTFMPMNTTNSGADNLLIELRCCSWSKLACSLALVSNAYRITRSEIDRNLCLHIQVLYSDM